MYKYIKGITVLSEERMPNALEIAQEYHLWMPLTDSLTPNGELIDFLIKAYVERNNFKVSEYYYINAYDVSFPVYPEQLVIPVMTEFLKYLKDNNVVMDRNIVYTFGDIEFIFYCEPIKQCKIISLEEYKKKKEGESNDKLPKM